MPDLLSDHRSRAAWPRRAALAAALATLSACGPTRLAPLTGPSRGRVIVLRGLLNVFSTGMNVLTAQLRARNFDASVHNYVDWRRLAAEAEDAARDGTLARPFAIIGHSFGADDAVVMANHLGRRNVPVDLLVTFDATAADPIGPGVRHVLNFYQTRDPTFVRTLATAPGFSGTLENRLVTGESHISIDKDTALHTAVIDLLQAMAGPHYAAPMAGPAGGVPAWPATAHPPAYPPAAPATASALPPAGPIQPPPAR